MEDARAECQRRWTLRVVCVATALLLLNVAAPNVALPDMARDLDASFTDLQWVLSGYALTLAVFLLSAGTLADRFGRRRLFLVGQAVFAFASVLCAVAPGPLALIVARVLQGVGAAIVFPSSLALLAEEFQGPARRRAIGIWGAVIGLAFAAGPLIGGVLVDVSGWRAIFAFNLVLGAPAFVLAWRYVPESRDPAAKPIDWAGLATLCASLFLVVFAILRGNAVGWGSPVILVSLAAGLAGLALFVAVERRGREPMIELSLFANRTFAGATIVVGLMAAASFGAIVYVSLFLLNVQHRGPVEAGLVLAPLALVSFVVSALAGRANERLPLRGAIVAGMAISAVGMVLLHGVTPQTGWGELLVGLAVLGAGIGLANPLVTFAHLGVLPPARGGLASALNNTARQLGVALGIAGLGALLQASVRDGVAGSAGAVPAGTVRERVLDRVADGDLAGALQAAPAGARPSLSAAYEQAFSGALDEVFVVGIVGNLLAAVLAAVLIRGSDMWSPERVPARRGGGAVAEPAPLRAEP